MADGTPARRRHGRVAPKGEGRRGDVAPANRRRRGTASPENMPAASKNGGGGGGSLVRANEEFGETSNRENRSLGVRFIGAEEGVEAALVEE